MAGLRNIFHQPSDVTTVPEMLASFRAVKRKLPELRRNAGGESLFEASVFKDLTVAALVEAQKLIQQRPSGAGTPRTELLTVDGTGSSFDLAFSHNGVRSRKSVWTNLWCECSARLAQAERAAEDREAAQKALDTLRELYESSSAARRPPPWTKLLHNNSALRRAADEARRSVDIFNRVQEYWLCVKLLSGGLFSLYHSP